MLNRQKETVLELLKSDKTNKNYTNRYWLSYKDFLDPTDGFTSFSCEDLDGKRGYISKRYRRRDQFFTANLHDWR